MEQFHKKKLISLILAGIALVGIILPWVSVSGLGSFGGGSVNGFRSWGYLSVLGVAGIAYATLSGTKLLDFGEDTKKIALGSFGAIALGALIFFIRLSSFGNGFISVGSGIGLWITLIAGIAGLAILLGFVKTPDIKKPL